MLQAVLLLACRPSSVVRSRHQTSEPTCSPTSVSKPPSGPAPNASPYPRTHPADITVRSRESSFSAGQSTRTPNAPEPSSFKVQYISGEYTRSKSETKNWGGPMWPSSQFVSTSPLFAWQPRGLQDCMAEAWECCQYGSVT